MAVSSILRKLDVRNNPNIYTKFKLMTIKMKKINFLSLIIFITFFSCSNETKKRPDLKFSEHKYADKVHLLGNDNYPACEIDISFLAPQDTISFRSLQESMMTTFFDSLYLQSQNIEKLLYLTAQENFNDFYQQEEYLSQDTMDMSDTYNWDIILKNDVVYQGKRFVSFSNETYAYLGGAHGDTQDNYYTFDLETNQLLSASDFFLPNKCEEIIELQKQSLEKDDEELGDLWLDGLKCNDNFYLDESGIIFHYNQYEIASYAAGPIDIFISFEEIQEFLQKPELIERFVKK